MYILDDECFDDEIFLLLNVQITEDMVGGWLPDCLNKLILFSHGSKEEKIKYQKLQFHWIHVI